MSIYIKNSGFTKTSIEKNNKKKQNEIKWSGEYDGKMANLDIAINDDGHKENMIIELGNNDLKDLLGIQPINLSLEDRLTNDFLTNEYNPLNLNPLLKKKKISKRIKHGRKLKQDNKKSKKRRVKK